ncbi:MAG: TetR/AcrR family transcriptional regulator [Rugosibacter sp.]
MENTTSPRQRRKEARPAELMAAALELFVSKGFAATRLDDVAAHAGVAKGTLYLYFDSKEALFKAAIQQGIVPVLEQDAELVSNFSGNSVALLQWLVLNWWERASATPLGKISRIIMSEAGNFPELADFYSHTVIIRGRDLLRQALVRGMASGEFRTLDVDAAIDAIFTPMMLLLIWGDSLGVLGCLTQKPDRYLATHLDLILNGLTRPMSATAT